MISCQRKSHPGFTLVELLVVISIMAALTALMLPRLRVVNKDRNIREAARVVGSKFAEASDRARRDGKAALTLVRNSNMVDLAGVQYAATSLYLSRAVPNYVGDDGTPGVFTNIISGETALRIVEPLEFDPATPEENVVRVGDSVRFNVTAGGSSSAVPVTSPVAYLITNVVREPSGGRLQLTLERKLTQPPLPRPGTQVSFVIERQPKILRSSITDLPPGYIVDLRLSGPVEDMDSGSADQSGVVSSTSNLILKRPLFYEQLRPGAGPLLTDQYGRIDIFFDSTGGISSIRSYRGLWGTTGTVGVFVSEPVTEPLHLFVSPSQLEDNSSPIYSASNLWVTINNSSGNVNIGYNNPPIATTDRDASGAVDLHELLEDARTTADAGVSAAQ